MRILYVCKSLKGYIKGYHGNMAPFNMERVLLLRSKGIIVDVFLIKESGIKGYLKSILKLNKRLKNKKYDIVQATYALSGMVISFQSNTPIVISYIGSDVNIKWIRIISKLFLIKRAKANIFVSEKLYKLAGSPKNGYVIPFGINVEKFYPMDQKDARIFFNMDLNKKYVLFSSRFDRKEKNADLALSAINLLQDINIELIELKDIPDENINILFNACDLGLLTSIMEGSPQFIKEAMACNLPIVSTNVGDVKDVFNDTEGCFISSFNPEDVAEKIKMALDFGKRTNGRNKITNYNNHIIASKVISIYQKIAG